MLSLTKTWMFLGLLLAGCASLPTRAPSSEPLPAHNEIQPFTSDGCTRFPDGIPYFNEKKWLGCCVQHDLLYWQGGSADQRLRADQGLRSCIEKTGDWAMAEAMYAGVRVGGYPYLTTPWHWGYGWVLNRGYDELSSEERAQVEARMSIVPKNLAEMPITYQPVARIRKSVSGDYCLDDALKQMKISLGREFKVVDRSQTIEENESGWWKTYSVTAEGCAEPFLFTFLLYKPDACSGTNSEWTARDRIRLQSLTFPRACLPVPAE